MNISLMLHSAKSMTSIRKTKKALKRELRRIDEKIISSKNTDSYSDRWDLYLYRNYYNRKLDKLKGDRSGCIIPKFDGEVYSNFKYVLIGLFAPREINNPTFHEEIDKALSETRQYVDEGFGPAGFIKH